MRHLSQSRHIRREFTADIRRRCQNEGNAPPGGAPCAALSTGKKDIMSYDANSAYPAYPAQPAGPGGTIAGASNPDDLSLPLYGASFAQAVKRFFKKYATFSGRASRSEYWWIALFMFLLQLVPLILMMVGGGMLAGSAASVDPSDPYASSAAVDAASGPASVLMIIGGILIGIIILATIVPTIALSWRRLHDANFPGPLFFLNLIPSVGSLIVLILMLMPPKPEGQRFDA